MPFGRALSSGILALALASAPVRAATFTVTNSNDGGPGSLRAAILSGNATNEADTIQFNIPGAGVHRISPTSALPTITSPLTIDGYSQPGYSTLSSIEISGALLPPGTDGLHVTGGGSTIRGLTINGLSPALFGGGGSGIVLENGGGNSVFTCNIGTNPSGTAQVGSGGVGVLISNSPDNVIGWFVVTPGPGPLQGNVIGGNFVGVSISGAGSSGNVVRGNRIGTVANSSDGVVVTNGSHNEVSDNNISGNGGNGIALGGDTTDNLVHHNVVSSNQGDGIQLNQASRNVVEANTVVMSGRNGILVFNGSNQNVVRANFVGTDGSASSSLGNALNGILVSGANDNTIGSQGGISGSPADRNVVAGNATNGIRLRSGASGNRVYGNWVGIGSNGSPLANQEDGVQLNDAATGNEVGGTFPFMPNFIGGNAGNGVRIADATTTGNHLFGNSIGVGEAGTAVGNAGHGVLIEAGASGNAIGGVGVGEPNLIAHNLGSGVFVESGTSNEIVSRIFGNGGLGIDLAPAGVTGNDVGDADSGANGLQNFPVLVSEVPANGPRTVAGTLQSAPGSSYRIDLYSSTDCDPSGNGEGELFLGSAQVMTDGNGAAAFEINADVFLPANLTATATDAAGNTSEFSVCLPVATSLNTIAPCRLADTRQPDGPFGGPALSSRVARSFGVNPQCGIPASALALALNVTVTGPSSAGHLTVYSGIPVPPTSTLNYGAGQTRANNVVVPLAPGRVFQVRCVQQSGTVDVVIDVAGYFE